MTATQDDTATSDAPVWISSNEIDPSWIRHHTKFTTCSKCTAVDISNAGRLGKEVKDGATIRLTVSLEGSSENVTLILKQASESVVGLSKQLGLARESLFFSMMKSEANDNDIMAEIPEVYYSFGDMKSGAKHIIMEDLGSETSTSFIDSGILFHGNPNNWSRDIDGMIAKHWNPASSAPSPNQIASATFLSIARVHAKFWKSEKLLEDDFAWLRGQRWVLGQSKESWEASQGLVVSFWKTYTSLESSGDETSKDVLINWDPVVREAVEVAVKGISWEAQQERLNKSNAFTLCHGDFWPGNIMLATDTSNGSGISAESLRFLDWEMVGLGSGPQDLGQYVLSSVEPAVRRECEHEVIREYYGELVRLGVKGFSWEECWKEYSVGGVERWLWFLVYFCGQSNPNLKNWAQYFHDQIASFMKDHKMDSSVITQPRP